MSEFEKRLSETVAWCSLVAGGADPGRSLRTPALRPSVLGTEDDPEAYAWLATSEASDIVDHLCMMRAALLGRSGQQPVPTTSAAGQGRLLVSAPHVSVWDGASEHASAGFIDAFDAPPWDTWITVIASHYGQHTDEPLLVSWVPAQFALEVQEAIDVNPVQNLRWATDADFTAITAPPRVMAAR